MSVFLTKWNHNCLQSQWTLNKENIRISPRFKSICNTHVFRSTFRANDLHKMYTACILLHNTYIPAYKICTNIYYAGQLPVQSDSCSSCWASFYWIGVTFFPSLLPSCIDLYAPSIYVPIVCEVQTFKAYWTTWPRMSKRDHAKTSPLPGQPILNISLINHGLADLEIDTCEKYKSWACLHSYQKQQSCKFVMERRLIVRFCCCLWCTWKCVFKGR